MITLHKPERVTYGEAVEAQHSSNEYFYVHCDIKNGVTCRGLGGPFSCCG